MDSSILQQSKNFYILLADVGKGEMKYRVIHRDHGTIGHTSIAYHEAIEVMLHLEQLLQDVTKKWDLATAFHSETEKAPVVQLLN
tara:strand:- start:708 stop:962 length:255 start_codon:yes stop_codon:yes gene_type:complete